MTGADQNNDRQLTRAACLSSVGRNLILNNEPGNINRKYVDTENVFC
jgi:hypothetical protein